MMVTVVMVGSDGGDDGDGYWTVVIVMTVVMVVMVIFLELQINRFFSSSCPLPRMCRLCPKSSSKLPRSSVPLPTRTLAR